MNCRGSMMRKAYGETVGIERDRLEMSVLEDVADV